MTVKELCNLIPEDNKVKFAISGNLYKFIHTDPFQIAIYGDYEMELIIRSSTERKPYWIQMEAMNRVQTIMKEMTEQPPILKECHIETKESGFW